MKLGSFVTDSFCIYSYSIVSLFQCYDYTMGLETIHDLYMTVLLAVINKTGLRLNKV